MAITSSFHLQIEYRLKLWTRDFPNFETTYGMHEMNFGKIKMCPTVAKMGVQMQQVNSWCARWRILRCGDFAATKWVYRALKWNSCAKGWFHSCETPFQMASQLRNGGFSRYGGFAATSQLRNRCTGLRNGTHVPRDLFAAAKIFAEGAWRLRNHFAARIDFRSGSLLAAKFHRPCFFLAFWAPLDSQLPYFNSFDIPLDFNHPKTYITSKQIKIKVLKSKLKHWNQN